MKPNTYRFEYVFFRDETVYTYIGSELNFQGFISGQKHRVIKKTLDN